MAGVALRGGGRKRAGGPGAERRAGERFAEMPKDKGAQSNPKWQGVPSHDSTAQRPCDIGVTKDESSRGKAMSRGMGRATRPR
jgi:hypothetical protein